MWAYIYIQAPIHILRLTQSSIIAVVKTQDLAWLIIMCCYPTVKQLWVAGFELLQSPQIGWSGFHPSLAESGGLQRVSGTGLCKRHSVFTS